jgi:ribosomal protein S27AE
MSENELICDECEPIEPPTRGCAYYPIERKVLQLKDGCVDADDGGVFRSDHTNAIETVYAECGQCGAILIDKRDMMVSELL